MMAAPQLNANQFAMTRNVGDLDLTSNPSPSVLTCRINPSSSDTDGFTGGQAVKLIDLAGSDVAGGGLPYVDTLAAITEQALGVVINQTRFGKVPDGYPVQVAGEGSVVWMLSTAAINRGVAVVANLADAAHIGYVITATGKTGKVLGITMDKASGADQLIRVKIIANGSAFAGSVSS